MSKRLIDVLGRENFPLADGFLHYFPDAMALVSNVSLVGDRQHNDGKQPMHWSRGKSTDHDNKILKHLEGGEDEDTDGTLHAAKVAWRAMARLQELAERKYGLDLPARAWVDSPEPEPAVAGSVIEFEYRDGQMWYVHNGGGRPVAAGTKVQIEFRLGPSERPVIGFAESLKWHHDGLGGDIMSYRIIE